MANSRLPQRSLFPGLALLFVGLLLLVHNYRGLDISHLLGHWWPLLIIFWGAIKLYERTAASRSGQPSASPISGGEILLVLGLLCLLGIAAGVDVVKHKFPFDEFPVRGDRFDFDLNAEPKAVPAARSPKTSSGLAPHWRSVRVLILRPSEPRLFRFTSMKYSS